MSNNTFSITRTRLLIKNNLVEHQKKYLYYLIGLLGIGFIVFTISLIIEKPYPQYSKNDYSTGRMTNWEEVQLIIYIVGLIGFGSIFASTSFVNFNNKGESIFYFIKPTSQVEKWLTEFIIHVLFFFLAYTLIFYILAVPATYIAQKIEYNLFIETITNSSHLEFNTVNYYPSELLHLGLFTSPKYEKSFSNMLSLIFSVYLTGCAFFMYGSVLFNQFSFFKTLLFGFVIVLIYVFYLVVIDKNNVFVIEGWRTSDFFKAYIKEEYSIFVEYSTFVKKIIIGGILVFVPTLLFTCSYLKLKEKEV